MTFLCMWQFSHCTWQDFYAHESLANVPDEIFLFCFCVCDSLAIIPDKIFMYVTV